MSPSTPRRPGPESTLDDVRSQLISAGIGLLRDRGVDIALGDISLSETIKAAGVTRSTAYRSLADDELAPQAVLHRELSTYLLTRYSRGDTRTTIEDAVGAELERVAEAIASADVSLRTRAMRCIIRVGANTSYQAVIDSPERAILTAVYGALKSSGATDWRHEALCDGERALTDMFNELYLGFAGLFGYQIKPQFTMAQFTTAGASMVEGMAVRQGVNSELVPIPRPTDIDGSMQDWTLFAIAFESLMVGMWEPGNPDDPMADLVNH